MERRRVALVGIDGFSPLWMDRFLSQGKLPRLGSIASGGATVALRSTLPATTPVAWATVATGCSPNLTGIDANLIHRPGDRLDRRLGCYSHRCQAEPLWATAARAGRRSYVVKFPVSYPSTTASFRLDGAAGWAGMKCLHELSAAATVDNRIPAPGGELRATDEVWRSEGDGGSPPLWRGRWLLDSLWGGPPLTLHVAVHASPDGRPTVAIADRPGWSRVLVRLRGGEWSAPLTVRAAGRRGEADFSFRVKVLECSGDPVRLRLYNTVVHERTGHSEPPEIWERHLGAVGPIEEQTDPFLFFREGIDLQTQLEVFRLNAEWLERAAVALLTGEPWDLFMIQVHFTDWAHHMLEGGLDPRHPDFRPEAAAGYEAALLASYRLADQVVGAIQQVLEPDTDLVVLGDHGQDLHHTTVHVNEWLAREGLLQWADGDEVDWERTQAFAAGNFVYLNLEGREPTGTVPAAAAAGLKARVIEGLLALEDPAARARPVLIAGVKEDFEPLGASGPGVGDVVFVCRSGYQSRNSRGALYTPTRLLREFTSGHDHFWPFDPRIQTRLFAAGPSFRRGYRHPRSEHLMDVAPTLCAALGIEPSTQCEGRPLSGILQPSVERLPLEPLGQSMEVPPHAGPLQG
ncbi:MAG TPA: alkaline phosphatase family protein [Thermoanaerobaculia bacterium]